MTVCTSKVIWLSAFFVMICALAVASFCFIRSLVRVSYSQGYRQGLEQQFLHDAKRLRQQFSESEFDCLVCKVYSAEHGQTVALSPTQAAQAREVVLRMLDADRMHPAFLRFSSTHTIAPTGMITFFSNEEDAEHGRNAVLSMRYYEGPNAVCINSAIHFDVCVIDIFVDPERHAMARALIDGAFHGKEEVTPNPE